MENLEYLLVLHSIDGLGPVRLKRLLDFYQDPKLAWEGKPSGWRQLRIPEPVIDLWQVKFKVTRVQDYWQSIQSLKLKILTIYDPGYPTLLKAIYDPPLIIYYQGEVKVLNKPALGVVGTRKISSYGRIVTEKLTKELVEAGLVIVSGLAKGVDTCAHQASLEAGGLTAAVLGGGLKSIYPPENIKLAEEIIAKGGIILSEQPPEYPSTPGSFPARNRIISGLSLGVLVTEAAEDSGSLITAKLALEQGREVFAVPGPITSDLSGGPTLLLKEGARLVSSGQDILDELGISQSQVTKVQNLDQVNLSELEKLVMDCLEHEQKQIDEICRQLQRLSAEVSSCLIKLEIQGLVSNLGGGVYLRLV